MGRYILTPLFPFLKEEMGWSREVIGAVITLQFWTYSILSVLIGRTIDKVGARVIVFLGGALLLLGLVLLSFSRHLWHFHLTYGLVLSLSVSMIHLGPNTTIVRKWFVRRAGLATGFITVGTALGQGIMVPAVGGLSVLIGWRHVSLIYGVAFGSLIMILAVLVVRSTPESVGLRPDGIRPEPKGDGKTGPAVQSGDVARSTGQVLRSRNFCAIFLTYSAIGIAFQGIMAHIVMWGVDLGMDLAMSGIMMTALTLPSLPIRVLGGWMGDRFGKKKVLICSNLSCALLWIGSWFFVTDTNSLLVFVVGLGMAQSVPLVLYTPYLGDLFGRRRVGTMVGVLTFGWGVIGGTGPLLWGWIVDKTGSYGWVSPTSAACYLIGAACLAMITSKPPSVGDRQKS